MKVYFFEGIPYNYTSLKQLKENRCLIVGKEFLLW
jgi:hypothetical protein